MLYIFAFWRCIDFRVVYYIADDELTAMIFTVDPLRVNCNCARSLSHRSTSDTAASSAPDDYVHSVSIDGTGDTVRSPTLVMVHGLANGGGIFTRNLRPLSAAFAKIHAVDWRGAGLSGRPTYEPDDHDSARDFLVDGLEAWRAKEGVDRIVLLGHSMGGLISAHYASRYPERVDHLVLVGPAAVQARPRRVQPGMRGEDSGEGRGARGEGRGPGRDGLHG